MRVALLVTHLLGSGHLSRMLTLARAFESAGHQAQVISGGMPAPHLAGAGIVQIEPLRSDGTNFTRLLDRDGEPVTPDLMMRRIRQILAALDDATPDVLITELFPFGRRVLAAEFAAVLAAVRARDIAPLILCSVRDILAAPSSAKKAERTGHILADFYDGVLVHSDPDAIRLEASWPVTPAIARSLRYTGFIAPLAPPKEDGAEGLGDILVSAGGGAVGRRLFATAKAASALLPGHRWRLLVGGGDAAEVCRRLNAGADAARFVAEPVRSDYRALLAHASAAVGQCGYNTAIDWLQAGVAGVFVPFAEAGETEQTLRARALSDRFGYEVVAEDVLTAKGLADAVRRAMARGKVNAAGLRLDGADESVRIVEAMLGTRP